MKRPDIFALPILRLAIGGIAFAFAIVDVAEAQTLQPFPSSTNCKGQAKQAWNGLSDLYDAAAPDIVLQNTYASQATSLNTCCDTNSGSDNVCACHSPDLASEVTIGSGVCSN